MANIEIIDGFVWAKVSDTEAVFLWENNIANIFVMYPLEDFRNWEAQSEDDMQNDGNEIWLTIKLGTESELIADWQEATERNNEKRSFMAWLQDKAESLIEE